METVISSSEAETGAIAAALAARLPGKCILFLEGDLGAGKSVFARSLIRALTGDPELNVPSPTYTLLQAYETPKGPIWHYDLYRMKEPEEIGELSWDDALSNGIVIIEWAERLYYLKPEGITVRIDPVPGEPHKRTISISE